MDLREQLQQHLGSAYTLERELGGGGMSRVFVANEVRLGRTVVIKVLSPDLAQGINAERFEREIRVAASLQQANIVPLHTAGEVNGIPYFTMPYVDGESLRVRITQGAIPIHEVMAILRDVTRALAYAHARGVVHRDIKPDNVLLSGGTAVVTDFGIAKAISASRTQAPGATLTQLGTSIGTPAYMAPEQVAGDPDIDHRVDLYALGCMAFELLTGQQPYANRTPQKMLAAHLSESVPSVAAMRVDAPPAIVSLVGQLMEKDPARRPQSATAVLSALDGITISSPTLAFAAGGTRRALLRYAMATVVVLLSARAAVVGIGLPDWVFPGAIVVMALGLPALLITGYVQRVARQVATATPTLTPHGSMAPRVPGGTMATMAIKAAPHLTWKRAWRGGGYALTAFVVLIAAFMVARARGIGPWGSLMAEGKLAASDRILLADLAAPASDTALVPIVDAAIRAALDQSTSLRLVTRAGEANVLQQMKRAPETRLADPQLVHDVAVRTNSRAILGGRIARLGNGYAVSLELTSTEGGALLASYQSTAGSSQDLLNVIDDLTRKLRSKAGESLRHVQQSIPLAQATTSSLDALRKYSDAVEANDVQGDFARAERSAREAVALDSTFALAWRKLAVVLYNSGKSAPSIDSALQRAAKYAGKLPDRERYLAIGAYYDQINVVSADRARALAAYQDAYAADSSSSTATNQLSLIFGQRRQWDSAIRYARRQYQLLPNPDNLARVALTMMGKGDTATAFSIIDTLVAMHPDTTDGVIASALASRELQRGNEGAARTVLAGMTRGGDPVRRNIAAFIEVMVDAKTGRLRASDSLMTLRDSLFTAIGSVPFGQDLNLAVLDIQIRGQMAKGIADLDRGLRGPEWTGMAPADRPYLLVATLYAQAGAVDRARAVLAEYQRQPAARAPDNQASQSLVKGELALAASDPSTAVREFRAAAIDPDRMPASCVACAWFGLARAFDQAKQTDSAIAYFTRYLAVPWAQRFAYAYGASDYYASAIAHKRLGELYDDKHDVTNALKQYGAFANQWKSADAELQPVVATVRRRMAELASQEKR